MGFGAAHRRDQGVVAIIPAGERDIGLTAYPGVGAIGSHHQFGRDGLTIFKEQQGARRAALQALGSGGGQQLDIAGPPCPVSENRLKQCHLDHPVLDNMAEVGLTQAGGIEVDMAETVLLPHRHLVVGLQAARFDAVPGTNMAQDLLASQAQGADPVIGHLPQLRVGQLSLHYQYLEGAMFQGRSEPQPHHAATDNHHIHILHLHHLILSGLTGWPARGCPQAFPLCSLRFAQRMAVTIFLSTCSAQHALASCRTHRRQSPGCARQAVP